MTKKKCTEEQVRNPVTGRCIKIGSALFKQLVKDGVQFSQEDALKITKPAVPAPVKKDTPVKKNVPVKKDTPAAVLIESPSKKLKLVMAKYIKEYKERKNINYIDKYHKNMCENNLFYPITTIVKNIQLSFSTTINFKNNYKKYLKDEKIIFEPIIINIIDNFNNYNKHIITRFTNKEKIDDLNYEWFNDMDNYIKNLSNYDIYTIFGYTCSNNNDIINKLLSGRMVPEVFETLVLKNTYVSYFPYYKQAMALLPLLFENKYEAILKNKISLDSESKPLSEWLTLIQSKESYELFIKIMRHIPYDWWLKVMYLFRDDLKRIIDDSPPLKKKMIVYRGVKNDYMLKGSKNQMYTNNCFISTSLNPYSALEFANDKCCFKRIVLYPGQKALFISGLSYYPNEVEFLLNVDTRFYVRKIQHISIYKDRKISETNICFKPEDRRSLQVVDILMLT